MSIIFNKRLRSAGNGKLMHYCPGCKMRHMIWTQDSHPAPTGAVWKWNGDTEVLTVTPSIHINMGVGRVCHYFIRNNVIEFCGDSTHEFRNQFVPLPDFPTPDEDDEPEDYMNMP